MQILPGWSAAAWPLVLACGLTGCKNPADDIVIGRNPAPQHSYRVILDATHAPGVPVNPTASVSFEVPPAEELCLIRDHGLMGEHRMPWEYIEVPLKETAPGRFEGVMHLDWVKDENYFGLGTCRWRMNTLNVGFQGSGGMGFNVGMGYTRLAPGAKEDAYYLVDQFSEDSSKTTFKGASQVPTNLHKDNLDFVADTTKFFPLHLSVEPVSGEGLTPDQELQQRILKAAGATEHKPKSP